MKTRTSDGQTEIQFRRCELLATIRHARLPAMRTHPTPKSPDGTGVSEGVAKGVLKAIDDHGGGGWCWLSFETIATETGFSIRQVKRAAECLVKIGVLLAERRKVRKDDCVTVNWYAIEWTELRKLRDDLEDQSAVVADQSAVVADQSAVVADQSAVAALKAPLKRKRSTPPPTPKESDPSEAVEAALVQAGIGNSKECAKAMRARGLAGDAAIEQVRVGQATIAKLAAARKLKNPVGALHWFLTRGCWPVDMPAASGIEQKNHRDLDAEHWPTVRAMSMEEQMAILPDEETREALRDHGPDDGRNRYTLVFYYVEALKHGKRRLASATP